MILFEKDWARYPNAIVDMETTNESFIRLASVYKQMGISNNVFHLSLLQPALQGVDPFANDLSNETKAMIALECQWNPWYSLREIMRLPPSGGPKPIRYKANRGNISLTWSFFNHVDFCLIQPRQTGKSASTDVLVDIILQLMGINTKIQLITKDHSLRRQNVERLKSIRDLLPAYINSTRKDDVDNTEMVTVKTRGNQYLTAVGQKGIEAADNLGRGLTSAILHCDEVPYIPNIHISLPVALGASTAARDNAKANNGLYGNIFTTTAGRKDTKDGRFAYNLVHNAFPWNEILYDTRNQTELHEYLIENSNSKTPIINGTFSHRQLGKTDEWLKEAVANTRSSEDLANRDFFNIWTSGTESSPLSITLNQTIHRSELDPLYIERTKDKYMVRWYIPRENIETVMQNTWHVIALDSSNAVGKDNNGLLIIDVRDLSVVAACSTSEANLYRYAQWIFELLIKYPKTIFIPENKSSGQGILDTLIHKLPQYGHDPFKRIFNRVVEEKELHPDEFAELHRPLTRRDEHFYLKHKGKFGFMTTGNRRNFLYDTVFQQAARTSGHLVKDAVLSQEIRGLVTKNGRVDHPEGGHDDLVIAWLLGHYLLNHSKNLDFYGLDMRQVLSRVSEDGAVLNDEELEQRGEQAKLRLEIENLKDQLKVAKYPADIHRLEFLIKQKIDKTELDGGAVITMASIRESVTEYKSQKKKLRDALFR